MGLSTTDYKDTVSVVWLDTDYVVWYNHEIVYAETMFISFSTKKSDIDFSIKIPGIIFSRKKSDIDFSIKIPEIIFSRKKSEIKFSKI
jgi:hypothetical protein